jgi:hypothetical protein
MFLCGEKSIIPKQLITNNKNPKSFFVHLKLEPNLEFGLER